MTRGLNGKFECIYGECSIFMKRGKVYDFANGRFTREDGCTSFYYKNVRDFHSCTRTKIEPYFDKNLDNNSSITKTNDDYVIVTVGLSGNTVTYKIKGFTKEEIKKIVDGYQVLVEAEYLNCRLNEYFDDLGIDWEDLYRDVDLELIY